MSDHPLDIDPDMASRDQDAFDLPGSSPDHGQRIGACYLWIFPDLMLNVYPLGISVNVVKPLGPDRTRVSFLSYVWDATRLDRGAGSGPDRVEREHESVVGSAQRGVRSCLYSRNRCSPSREAGVHRFHRLIARHLVGEDAEGGVDTAAWYAPSST
jgi:choline monooxygenase